MAGKEPTAGQPYRAGDTTLTPWAEARERLARADTYWLATVRTDGLPHLVPVLGVWVGGALHFVASRTSRKARNLERDPALRHRSEQGRARSGGRGRGHDVDG
jgi:nitroimidazol reductase NimA-like FMN-containing flavoprotein (pyridoxamine 5'-phosphate oxidase superfamily)